MDNEIYRNLVSAGRQDLANNFLVEISEKDQILTRLAELEIILNDVKIIVKAKKSASKIVEQLAAKLKEV